MVPRFSAVPKITNPSAREFHSDYVAQGNPVLIACGERWKAHATWSPEYFARIAPNLSVPVKEYRAAGIHQSKWTFAAYADFLRSVEGETHSRHTVLPYCHDIPIFTWLPELLPDVSPFPVEYLPAYYRSEWWRYVQFFMGPAHSLTPLHFDTLLTHNLFFQIYGSKRFTIYAPSDARYCRRRGWRWFDFDPEHPDYERIPESRRAIPHEVIVGPGDVLYLPPGTLHHVRGLGTSISFNIDFHTRASALKSLLGPLRGMPRESLYYNALITLGVAFGAPEPWVFRRYKPYLSYVV
ncbi:cupin-like domain-containing protein [Pendulispora brunnea]|uniref:Cupin-like domain-containing protein n=1 Tax=Pendulispora brunnea TaxID=2905690 RepID=A0ABZ2K6Z7_9BACT